MAVLSRALKWGAALVLVALAYNIVFMSPGTSAFWSVLWGNARAGNIGVGIPGENSFDFSTADLEPGDILLGGNPGNSWGHWTHAALYVGDGMVADTLLRYGVHLSPANRFTGAYQQAGVLKVRLPPEVKQQAVQNALGAVGRPFNLLSGRRSDGWFYCTKLAWWAYWRAGYDLDPGGGYWVVPDRFLSGPAVTLTASPDY